MIKSIWSIGEDGSGLGYNVVLTELAYDRIVEGLSVEDLAIFDNEEWGGNIFVLEEAKVSKCCWSNVVEESKSFAKEAKFEDVVKRVNEVIAEYKRYKDD